MPWPHELFSAVYKHFPKEWIARIRGVADLGDFWRRKSYQQSADIYSFCSLVAQGSTKETNFIVAMLFARSQVWPDVDDRGRPHEAGTTAARLAGSPLADGYRGVVFLLRGDLDYLSKSLELQHASASQPCCLCLADRSAGLNFLDCRPGARWQSSVHTTPVWQRRFGSASQNPLWRAPGITAMCYYPDVMRNKHLGMDAYFLGGVLKVMLQYAPLPQIFEQCKAHWREARDGNHFGQLRETMFLGKRGDYPKLKGKAAEARLLVAWRRLREAHGLRSTYAEQIELGLQRSKDIDVILDEARGELFFHDQTHERYVELHYHYAAMQTALHKRHWEQGERVFNVTIKMHYAIHGALLSKHCSPRLSWCYSGEDLMQKAKVVLAACRLSLRLAFACLRLLLCGQPP
ncbi:unnamed protein product [Effrenium voratum]|uniref:Uncharacterized protein n=1 Tax=Effrenium voratum TaxID=2562239 RepID=A0AA36HM36_9DINO|nr:unnamed protein product [Effrenium voratum]